MKMLLIGGSKSGKSTTAQRICRQLADGAPLYYWATMTPRDEEDRERIARHIADRDGWGFQTVECSRELRGALAHIDPAGTVLLDSVTAALSEAMFCGAAFDAAAPERVTAELLAVSEYTKHFVCVCDDLFRGGEVYEEWTEIYIRGLAQVCRALGRQYDFIAELTAGQLRIWKGEEKDEAFVHWLLHGMGHVSGDSLPVPPLG